MKQLLTSTSIKRHLEVYFGPCWTLKDKASVIRQKDESLNGCYKKTKNAKFPEKQSFYPLIRNARFSKNLACFVFL